MRKLFFLICTVFLTIPSSLLAWDDNNLDQLWRTESIEGLVKITEREDFSSLYAHYRLAMVSLNHNDKKTAKKSLKYIRETLKDHYKTQDEAALYSAALGISISLKPWQAAFIASGAEDALLFSEKINTDHAPTLLVRGIALFNTPKMMGGDKKSALIYFENAITRYQHTEAWGMEDALLWKIKTLKALKKTDQANVAKQLLLEQFPDYLDAIRTEL